MKQTLVLGFFLWLGLCAHGSPAQASVAPPAPLLSVPAIRCDLRTETPVLHRARLGSSHTAQSQSSPAPAFERAPDTWRDLRISHPGTFVAAAQAAPFSSHYLVRTGLSPPQV